MPRRLPRRSVLAGLTMAGASTGELAAQSTGLKFGTGGEGGGFVVYAGAFVDAVKWANPSVGIKPVPTRGSVENVPMLQEGKLDIGLVFGEVAQQLFNSKQGPPTQLKVICTVYASPGMFVVRADSRYRTIEDLKGRPVVWNSKEGALALQARYVLDALGLDPDKDFEPIYTDRMTDGPAMLMEGRASALWGSGNRWPGFIKVASDPRGARFITPDKDQIDRIVHKHSFMRRIAIPPGRYPGQSDALLTVGSWSYVLARPFLDDSVGYALAAALHKVEKAGSLFGGQLAESTVKNTLVSLPRLDALQGGAELYYREIGAIR
ncbi:TAXI family TRAP transporter solute-binding subunit [Reyranella soli]|nr:TAXI family TRAP transporter solute-binding subunit [Reyranella soli]